MQVYLVGGAVRDGLLGLPIKDKDFMVVGTDDKTMKSLGFHQVGADFPVFLHPKTQAEYALARLERKDGKGYQGFTTNTKGVSLKDDLLRRDLTINALAIEVSDLFDDTPKTGQVLDFYGGVDDLKQKILRHVSPAFSEDSLRVLRVARFFARFAPMGFTIADSTKTLMQQISQDGELSYLSRERIWTETARALSEKGGFLYFACLYELGILPHLLPSLAMLWADKHLYQQTQNAVNRACNDNATLNIRFASLLAGFEYDDFADVAYRLNMPKALRGFIASFLQLKPMLANLPDVLPEDWLTLLEKTKVHKDTQVLLDLLCVSDYWQNCSRPDLPDLVEQIVKIYQSISMADIDKNLTGAEIGQALYQKRLQAITNFLTQKKQTL